MKKTKFNVIDIVIIVLVVAIIGVGAYIFVNKFTNASVEEANTVNVDFTIEVNGLTKEAAESFNKGDDVTFGETTSGSGKIIDVVVKPYEKISKNTVDGTYVLAEVPEEYTALVTISSNVNKTETEYKSGDEIIAIGKEMPFNAVGAAAEECYIVDLKESK